jgi:hypothetical protein
VKQDRQGRKERQGRQVHKETPVLQALLERRDLKARQGLKGQLARQDLLDLLALQVPRVPLAQQGPQVRRAKAALSILQLHRQAQRLVIAGITLTQQKNTFGLMMALALNGCKSLERLAPQAQPALRALPVLLAPPDQQARKVFKARLGQQGPRRT